LINKQACDSNTYFLIRANPKNTDDYASGKLSWEVILCNSFGSKSMFTGAYATYGTSGELYDISGDMTMK
jgi:hypothetical protein